jgi:hypothetical protein
MMLESELM